VFDQHWDGVTQKTRGLIVDDVTDEIIARPYEKFFAYNTPGISKTYPRSVDNIEKEFGPPIITEKINGCLGTYWKYDGQWGIATKGSFNSEHAKWATEWMKRHEQRYGTFRYPDGYTPVFEIICQDIQPHVIKYDTDECVLLNFVNIETGEELARYNTTYYAVQNVISYTGSERLSLQDALQADSDKFEGYVATYNRPGQVPFKLKIKFPSFLANRKAFYEEQKRQREAATEPKTDHIRDAAKAIVQEALVCCTTRKEFAEYFNKPNHKPYASLCFQMLDYDGGKSVDTGREGTEETSTVG
jgi:tRNA splicing ligase